MILHKLGQINKNQRGFTLIELVIAIAITSLISGGITMTISQMVNYSALSTAHMTAVKQVENAIHWISRDAQMAQIVEPAAAPDPDGFPLTLTWVEWDNTKNEVTYSIVDSELERNLTVNPGEPSETVVENNVARHIDPDESSCVWDDATGKLTFTLTATVSGFPREVSEVRVCEVIPRPN